MKRILSALLLGLGLLASAPAHATCSINSVPQVGVLCDVMRNATYSGTSVGLVPVASATDIFCISAGASKGVAIRQISIAGTAGTAVTTPFLVYQRSALDTSGTAATGLALPVGTPLLPSDPASTAVLTAYTGNPSVAATPILMDALLVDLPVTTAAGGLTTATRVYGSAVDIFNKGLNLAAGSALQYCINLNGVSVSSGVLTINMIWTEQ